jgi:cytochrome P450
VTCPARFDPELDLWVVSEPDQVRSVFLDPARYSPVNAVTAYTTLSNRALRILATAGFALPPTLASNPDPESHLPIRQAVTRFFSPARVTAAEHLTRRLITEQLGPLRSALDAGATVDLVATVTAEPPSLVMLDLLQITDVPIADLKLWSQDSLELFWGNPSPERQEELARSAADFYRWLWDQVSAARRKPGSDLFSRLLELDLTDEEICATAYFVLIAGHETTSQLIAAGLHHLIGDPARWRALGTGTASAADAVEDVLRTRSSVHTWRRVSTAPGELGGVTIPTGAPLLLELTGTGGPADLAFGFGVHRCLGAGLARMETRVALEQLALALPDATLVEPEPPLLDLLSFRAPTQVLIRSGRR